MELSPMFRRVTALDVHQARITACATADSHAALETVGIAAWVVNAWHAQPVPGRKTDICDAQWLAILVRAGLLRATFIPCKALRERRLVSRQWQWLVGMLASEENRLHKVQVDGPAARQPRRVVRVGGLRMAYTAHGKCEKVVIVRP